jgi:hypothetical protein
MSAEQIMSIVKDGAEIGDVFPNVENLEEIEEVKVLKTENKTETKDVSGSPYYKRLEKRKALEEENEILRENVIQTLESYLDLGMKNWELSMACSRLVFYNLLDLNLKRDEIEYKNIRGVENQGDEEEIKRINRKASTIISTVGKFHDNNLRGYASWEQILRGTTAEVAVAMAYKQGGFDVFLTNEQDDVEGGVDLLVFAENVLFTIQIKSSSFLKNIVVEDITPAVNNELIIEEVTKIIKNPKRERKSLTQLEINNLITWSLMEKVKEAWDDKSEDGDSELFELSRTRFEELSEDSAFSCEKLFDYLAPTTRFLRKNKLNKERDTDANSVKKVIPLAIFIPNDSDLNSYYDDRGFVRRLEGSISKLSNVLSDRTFTILDEHKSEKWN